MPAATASRRRPLGAFGAVAVAAAVVCAGLAFTVATSDGDADTAPATLAVAPSTVAPVSPDPPAATSPLTPTSAPPSRAPEVAPGATAVPTTTAALSPLSELVGEPVSVEPVAPLVDVPPTSVRIAGVLDGAPVIPVGIAPDGQLEIPGAAEAGWYRLGAAPGQPGATVIAAHVSWQGSLGPFARLADVELGATVELSLANGSTRTYEVVERAQYGKLMLPREEIWRSSGPEALVLITCGGAFNPDIRRYADNIVVTAVPVA